MNTRAILVLLAALPCLLSASGTSSARARAAVTPRDMRDTIERFTADRAALGRTYPLELSVERRERMKRFYGESLAELRSVDFPKLSRDGQVDYLLLRNLAERELQEIETDSKAAEEAAPLMPFAPRIIELADSRRKMQRPDGAAAAAALAALAKEVGEAQKQVDATLSPSSGSRPRKTVALRAARLIDGLRSALQSWYRFYDGYDPLFTWWCAEPYKQADQALGNYAAFLRSRVGGVKPGDQSAIVGDPIGRTALMNALAAEMIPYNPEELIAIANRELAWCEEEMRKASRDLGFGEDWRKALEHVKQQHVEPGKQPEMIRDLALEAIEFVEKRDLVTVPPLAKETWRMEMLSPERQLISPFFLGGEVIQVAFPTSGMSHEQKMMSMRGNNIHFSRATVQHELIPGHHLQQFMNQRNKPYRRIFSTPFWTEGWALYWELLLWDLDFPKTPENRIGMLFWRMHRCARIIFSLSFHLEKMTPEEAVDFLVDRVGHERENAAAEVRRSFAGMYGPLYQAAYLLGGFQFYALHKELVDGGKMTNRAFHDAILKENSIPVEMVRAILTNQKLSPDFRSNWKFR